GPDREEAVEGEGEAQVGFQRQRPREGDARREREGQAAEERGRRPADPVIGGEVHRTTSSASAASTTAPVAHGARRGCRGAPRAVALVRRQRLVSHSSPPATAPLARTKGIAAI